MSLQSIVFFGFLLIDIGRHPAVQREDLSRPTRRSKMKQVFSTIENQTSYRFSYKSDIIDHRKDITIRKSIPRHIHYKPW